ncbi:sel1 repeat family protein [bacterium]|nr:sel1 repeat family protein [bacterium]
MRLDDPTDSGMSEVDRGMSVTLRCSRGIEQDVRGLQKAPRSRIAVLGEVCYLPAMKTLLPLLCLLSALALSACSPPPYPEKYKQFEGQRISVNDRTRGLLQSDGTIRTSSGGTVLIEWGSVTSVEALDTRYLLLGDIRNSDLEAFEQKIVHIPIELHRRDAQEGSAIAQILLGVRYYFGAGVSIDYKEAVKWWRKAADQGDASAQFNLGLCYANGDGVLEDDKEAVKWWRKAADQGDASAQFNLGLCYANGDGVLEDRVEAYAWYSVFCIGQEMEIDELREMVLLLQMSPEQIAQGQQRSKELLKEIEEKQKKAK